jgi:hypothetical protein
MIELIPLGLWEGALFSNVNAFLLLMILLAGVLGVTSGYASIGAYGALIVFVQIAVETDLWIFNSLLYAILGIIFVTMGFAVWGYVGGSADGGGESPA